MYVSAQSINPGKSKTGNPEPDCNSLVSGFKAEDSINADRRLPFYQIITSKRWASLETNGTLIGARATHYQNKNKALQLCARSPSPSSGFRSHTKTPDLHQ